MKCEYGCDQEAKFQLRNGKWCCSDFYTKCPENKRKNSESVKKAHKDGKLPGWKRLWKEGKIKIWNKGLDSLSDPRLIRVIQYNEMFCENSKLDRGTLKKIILKHSLIEYKCFECGLTNTWKNKLLVLELEHKNGNNKDARLKNLGFLCPNCHSQTSTFKGRNTKSYNASIKKVSDIQLITALNLNKTIRKALLSVGLNGDGGNYKRAKKLLGQVVK